MSEKIFTVEYMFAEMDAVTHLLHSCGQFQTELNDFIFGRGEIADACEGSPTTQTKRQQCDSPKHS